MLWVGTSGWQYSHWSGTFYPAKLPSRSWLAYYCERFRVVEVNNTFYHLPEASTFEKWREEVPEDFVVAVKMSRFLTHLKRLREPEEPVKRFMERAAKLGQKLGPVLVQLPPRFSVDLDRLARVLELFSTGWSDVRVAVEFRDPSWYVEPVRKLLEDHGVALVLADSPERNQPCWPTAGWGFVRFHEGTGTPAPCYRERALATWVDRIADLWGPRADVYAFFNNDARACALRDAVTFAQLAEGAGLRPTRVPRPDEVKVIF